MLAVYSLIYLALLTAPWTLCLSQEITYWTQEQRPRGTLIGNIKNSMNFSKLPSSEYKTLRFSFLPKDDPSSVFLRIKENTGEIFSNIALDREKICDPSDENCLVSFKTAVLSDSGRTFKVIPINIYIEDINDKYPIFPQNHISLEIPENTIDSYEIKAAVDNDAGINSIQSYAIEPHNGPFELEEERQPGGNTKLKIVLKEMLDRETKDSYKVRVIARDGGSPMRTGEVLVDIKVTDVNDHPPQFTKEEYKTSKAENATVGTPLVRVVANDPDLGENAQVLYKFVGKTSDMFSLNETSGEVLLEQRLDFEAQSLYRLIVEARDMGTPAQTSQAMVIIQVIDVNDDRPKIKFNLFSAGNFAEIPEDANPGRFVAHVSVSDGDSGINGEVSCRLDSSTFKLQKLAYNDFEVKLNLKLDREVRDTYIVSMYCQDGGTPSLSGSESFQVKVKDVNDHDPQFQQKVYAVTIMENNRIGANVVRVSATDQDIGENGRILYEMAGDAGNQFSVDKHTGKIKARVPLDRETSPEIVFRVIAKDRGIPRGEDTATVSVTVLDQNDESPAFDEVEYEFSVEENQKPGTVVGSVFAVDLDSGLGGDVIYFILPKTNPGNLFSISTTEGTITVNEELDRETSKQHTFTVRARDKGEPSLNSTVQVTVYVRDQNDNAPVITFPNSVNNSVDILHTLPVRSVITTIKGHDLDEGENGKTNYLIEDGNSKNLFSLDEVSGELTVRRKMQKKDAGNYALLIAAQDKADRSKVTRRVLHITVIQSNETSPSFDTGLPGNITGSRPTANEKAEKNSNTMMIIVICVVVATVIISVVLIASICIVLKKRDSRRPNYFVKPEEQKIMKQKESPSSSLSGKIPPPSSPNESDDNKLRKKEVSFSLEEVSQNCHNVTDSTHNTSFSTFKGQQPSSVTHSPSEQLGPGRGSSSHSTPTTDFPVKNTAQGDTSSLPDQPKEQVWVQKRPVEVNNKVKHLLELLHKDDAHSDTSGETFASDSGRGGSEDDGHCYRGQNYTPADQNQARYYATKYTPASSLSDGSLPQRDGGRKAGSPNGYTRFKSNGRPVPRLDLGGREYPRQTGVVEDDIDSGNARCSSFRQPNYTTFKSATLPCATPSPLASPLSCGSGSNLVTASGEGYYQNTGLCPQSHSLERTKQHSPMFKVKAPAWEPVCKNMGYPPPPPYPDVVNSHDFNFDEGIGESMAYCRDDDDTTTSGSYTVNQDEIHDDINQMYFTDVVV